MTRVFDTHAHLLDSVYADDRIEIIKAAAAVELFIVESALNQAEWLAAADLSVEFDNLWYTAGIHPHDAGRSHDFEMLRRALSGAKCLAVGEAGLDYHYKYSERPAQKKVFEAQMKIALDTGRPLVVHCREAYEDCLSMLASASRKWRGVVHCFSGAWPEAERFMDLGFYLGIDGPVTYPKSNILQDVVSRAPLDRLLVETDSPYLTPVPLRGKRNEPANVRYVVDAVAGLKNIAFAAAAEATSANAAKLFGLSLQKNDSPEGR